MHDSDHLTETPLSPALRAAIEELRAETPAPEAWRRRVLRGARLARATRAARRTAVAVGIAAGLCIAVGGVVWHRAMSEASRVASTTGYEARDATGAVRFSVVAPAAQRVALVGDFDRWNPRGVPMRRGADGRTWTVDVALPPGRHAFAYMVDGALHADPAAAKAVEDDFGTPSSVIVIPDRGSE